MWELYKENCVIEMTEPKKLSYYNKIFNTKFNLHFKPPQQDTCKTCDDFNIKIRGADDDIAKKNFETQRENIKAKLIQHEKASRMMPEKLTRHTS